VIDCQFASIIGNVQILYEIGDNQTGEADIFLTLSFTCCCADRRLGGAPDASFRPTIRRPLRRRSRSSVLRAQRARIADNRADYKVNKNPFTFFTAFPR
jgi:hypothetical protein